MENFLRLLAVILFHTLGWGAAYAGKLIFPHETCDVETISTDDYETFYPIENFWDNTNLNFIEMKVKFKGVSDGHIALTSTQNVTEPHYELVFGSGERETSEIRKSNFSENYLETISVPSLGILSKYEFRGFIIRYSSTKGILSVKPEGNDISMLYWKDPEPLKVAYFGFRTNRSKIYLVAFNCHSVEAIQGKKNFLNEFVFLRSIQKN